MCETPCPGTVNWKFLDYDIAKDFPKKKFSSNGPDKVGPAKYRVFYSGFSI